MRELATACYSTADQLTQRQYNTVSFDTAQSCLMILPFSPGEALVSLLVEYIFNNTTLMPAQRTQMLLAMLSWPEQGIQIAALTALQMNLESLGAASLEWVAEGADVIATLCFLSNASQSGVQRASVQCLDRILSTGLPKARIALAMFDHCSRNDSEFDIGSVRSSATVRR